MLVLLEGTAYSAGSRVNSRGFGDTETDRSIHIWHFFPNLDKYVEALRKMAGALGFDHVSIGTDQQVVP
jgi:microsomal dipeptidase-like Zn-dependent dipeptidase